MFGGQLFIEGGRVPVVPAFVLAFLLQGPAAASAGPPAWVAEALAWGAHEDKLAWYSAKGSQFVRYSTPSLRVALAAWKAKREERSLSPAAVPDDLTASELHVIAGMLPAKSNGRLVGMSGATSVTLLVDGVRVTPSRTESISVPMGVQEPGGAMRRLEGREFKAVFPMHPPIPPEARVVVKYEWSDGRDTSHSERTYKLDLKKARW